VLVDDVFLLGAGFSRAVSFPMPLTADLGLRVLDQQRSIHRSRTSHHSDICDGLSCDHPLLPGGANPPESEAWLSSLAEPQPYLYGPENDRRRALFEELAGIIDLEIKFAEHQAMSGSEPPDWLVSLIAAWHEQRAAVVTFNYDTLVEATFDHMRIPDPRHHEDHPMKHQQLGPSIIPNWAAMYGGLRLPPADSFRYVKLHGSTHWYWDETTRAADSIVQVGLRSGWQQPEAAYSSEDLAFRAPGKVAMIVPPTTAKSVYLDNPIIRLLWRTAYQALMSADRLFVLGYSLPAADLLVRSMLDDAVMSGRGREIWIVNLDGEVVQKFVDFGVDLIETHSGNSFSGMAAFVDEYTSSTN
jgi:hypothetical protein